MRLPAIHAPSRPLLRWRHRRGQEATRAIGDRFARTFQALCSWRVPRSRSEWPRRLDLAAKERAEPTFDDLLRAAARRRVRDIDALPACIVAPSQEFDAGRASRSNRRARPAPVRAARRQGDPPRRLDAALCVGSDGGVNVETLIASRCCGAIDDETIFRRRRQGRSRDRDGCRARRRCWCWRASLRRARGGQRFSRC